MLTFKLSYDTHLLPYLDYVETLKTAKYKFIENQKSVCNISPPSLTKPVRYVSPCLKDTSDSFKLTTFHFVDVWDNYDNNYSWKLRIVQSLHFNKLRRNIYKNRKPHIRHFVFMRAINYWRKGILTQSKMSRCHL